MTEENVKEELVNEDEIQTEEILEKTIPDKTETIEEAGEEETVIEVDPLVELLAEKNALEDRTLRLQAEIANIQRINTKDRQDAAKYRSQKLASELLDVIDNLERALQAETTSEDAISLKKGVEMVLQQFQSAFEREGIKVLDPLGEKFDPNFHQAVSIMPVGEDQEPDTVVNVLQKGYQLHERVIRPAMVIVAE